MKIIFLIFFLIFLMIQNENSFGLRCNPGGRKLLTKIKNDEPPVVVDKEANKEPVDKKDELIKDIKEKTEKDELKKKEEKQIKDNEKTQKDSDKSKKSRKTRKAKKSIANENNQ